MGVKNKAFLGSDNILHYWVGSKHNSYDVSNEAIDKNSIKETRKLPSGKEYEVQKIPIEVAKALLQTGEYCYTKGDTVNDYFSEVYHKCWETKSHLQNFENIERCGNASSNPCYGVIRYKNKNGRYAKNGDCPRCRVIWAIRASYKPLKWKIWDWLNVRRLNFYYFFHSIFKHFEVFHFVHSKKGKEELQKWADVLKTGQICSLIGWRRQFLKPLLKRGNFLFLLVDKPENGWIIFDPKVCSIKHVNETVEEYRKDDYYHKEIIPIWERCDVKIEEK